MLAFFRQFVPSRDLLALPTVRWLVISRFFADLFFYSTTIVLFQQQRGLNFTGMFLMESILSGAIWVADIPTSIWADRFGYHRIIIIGRAMSAVGMVVFAFARGFWLFALAEVLGGLALACISGSESALIYGSLPDTQGRTQSSAAFALLSLASSAGYFLGLFMGSFIGAYSPALAAAASVAPSSLSFLAALRLGQHSVLGTRQREEVSERLGTILQAAVRTIRSLPVLAFLSGFRSVAFALTNAIFWYNQPYFARAGIPVFLFGPLMAAAMVLQFLMLVPIEWFQRVFGTRVLLMLSCLLPGIFYVLLAWTRMPGITLLLVAGVISFSAWRQPLVEGELNERIPDTSRATTLSALSLIGSLAGIALNPLIGYIGDLGLEVTGIGLGLSLIVLCLCIPFLVSGSKVRVMPGKSDAALNDVCS